MTTRIIILIVLLSMAVSGQAPAVQTGQPVEQPAPNRAFTARLIAEIAGDVPNFVLAENRSFIYARLGQVVCRTDRKAANDLLQISGEELVKVIQAANARPRGRAAERQAGQDLNLRQTVVITAAQCNAEFALQMYYRSRPAAVEKLLNKQPEFKETNGVVSQIENPGVQRERSVEQNLLRMVAEQDPTRLMDSLLTSIKGPLTPATLGFLKRIFDKDAEKGTSLATETVDRLMRESFESGGKPNAALVSLATAILADFTRPPRPNVTSLAFDEAQMRSLLAKLVSHHAAVKSNPQSLRALMAIAEKISPTSAAQLKAIDESARERSRTTSTDPEVRRLLSNKVPAATAVAEAQKLHPASRREIANTTARDMVAQGQYEQAIGVIHSLIEDEDQLQDAIQSLNWYYAHQLMNEAKFAEAERLIDGFPDGNRQSALIALGQAIYRKERDKGKDQALVVLNKARMQLTQRPDTGTEYTALVELMRTFLMIDPNEAFRVMEPVMPKLNDLWTSAVTMAAFQGAPNFRQGEYILAHGPPPGFRIDWGIFRQFAARDPEKTLALINTTQNRELRNWLKLQIADAR
jgi:hypothetical protein